MNMMNDDQARTALLDLLLKKSVFHGDFTLASGAKSNVYVDCRLTTFDPAGALLVGQLVHSLIRRESAARKIKVDAVGGLTMGADPISLATGMHSVLAKDTTPLQVFAVRKNPKTHGQTKLIEGNFKSGDTVVVVDDVVTKGDSTIAAINAALNEGGKVAFVVVLVDREEGGRLKIEAMGYPVFPVFKRAEVFGS
jgi:orotate phosphoribosyltransferase